MSGGTVAEANGGRLKRHVTGETSGSTPVGGLICLWHSGVPTA
jgi:hypothetical protein